MDRRQFLITTAAASVLSSSGEAIAADSSPALPAGASALTVYDRATFSFIYTDSGRTTLSSYDLDKMKRNADGGVTLYVGPNPPAGLEANWIPTRGKRPMPTFRYYGATDALNHKTFVMPDFEEVNA
ncbi:DUF1214 domain-containing protein [Paraburkholderia sp. C35]|uniref:DUF1214 domain-containing protein n=1 Tax=Paraburkholderia sp. C35 TaxID=2126993 RepID=UPI001EF6DFAB|nr:DUF1214 domain-containing protein [Paraburkholderia sp. C35]